MLNDHEPIINHPGLPSQGEAESLLQKDGLRILARIIARELLKKHSAQAKKNNEKGDNPRASVDEYEDIS